MEGSVRAEVKPGPGNYQAGETHITLSIATSLAWHWIDYKQESLAGRQDAKNDV
jgi:hypothetical protein